MSDNLESRMFWVNGAEIPVSEMSNHEIRNALIGLADLTIDTGGENDEWTQVLKEELNDRGALQDDYEN